MKGIRTEEAIEIYWKPRMHYEAGFVTTFDFNGDVESRVHGSQVEWGDEWRRCGAIDLTDEMVLLSGVENFDAFADALTRQAVRLVVCGLGDDPGDVVEMFSDFGAHEFVVDGEYSIIDSHGEFQDLIGSRAVVGRDERGGLSAEIIVRDASFSVDLDDPATFTSFLICAKLE